jgi:hypothetical protein
VLPALPRFGFRMKSLNIAEGLGSVSRRHCEFLGASKRNTARFSQGKRSNTNIAPVQVTSFNATSSGVSSKLPRLQDEHLLCNRQ